MATQTRAVLTRLRRGPLTPLDALSELGVARLAARIYDLRRAGVKIRKAWAEVETRAGVSRVARYSLDRSRA